MLACVVGIPLAAVFGKSMPEVFRALLNGRWPGRTAHAEASSSDPGLAPVPSTAAAAALPGHHGTPHWQPEPSPLHAASPVVTPTQYTRPSTDPAHGQTAVAGRQPSNVLPAVAEDPATPVPATADRFRYVQERLRQMGAVQYRLEYWGAQQQFYRFSCRVAIAGDPGCTRHFEATDGDDLRAMVQVLRQVEAWRAEATAVDPRSPDVDRPAAVPLPPSR